MGSLLALFGGGGCTGTTHWKLAERPFMGRKLPSKDYNRQNFGKFCVCIIRSNLFNAVKYQRELTEEMPEIAHIAFRKQPLIATSSDRHHFSTRL